jgi:chromosome segregation ATPase
MKPTTFTTGRILLVLLVTGLTVGLVSWGHKQDSGRYQQTINDTVPKTKPADREKKIRDLDDVLDELDRADMKVNMEKVQKELEESMKKLDMDKIKMEIDRAMKEVDMEKIKKEVEESMSKIDFDKIKTEMAQAMKEIDAAKIQKEIQESLAKVEWDKMKVEMDKVKNIDMKKVEEEMERAKKEMQDMKPRLEKEMEKAKIEIEKAKVEIKEYKEFVNGLENDGLINKKEGYTLKHKDGELFINRKKASEQIYSKYRSFLEKHKKFNIEKNDDDFDINMD